MDEERSPEHPVDLSALDPTLDPGRWEAMVARITRAATPELERRAAMASPVISIAGWLRPALAAAAALAVVSAATLFLVERGPVATLAERSDAVPELNLPFPLGEWLNEDRPPTVVEVMVALEGEPR